jgi:uncharacterized membrane protein YfcA
VNAIADLLPQSVPVAAAAILVIASFLTSALTAAFGIGGGVALLAIMGYLLPVAVLIPVHGVVQWGSNAGRAFVQREFIRWDRVAPFVAGAFAGAAIGAPFVTELDDPLLKIAMGVFIIIVTWVKFPAMAGTGRAVMAVGGAATTFLSMFFGASGPLVSVFFAKAFDDRRMQVSSHAAAMTFQHGLKVVAFAFAGFAFARWLPLMALMVASGYAGTLLGTHLLHKLPEARFRLVFSLLMTALAADIIRNGLAGWLG